jgi:long-chain fatty acid transport protein
MRSILRLGILSALSLLAAPTFGRAQQGLYLPGGGAAHVSMGGASTATPVDAIGALYWNPAAIGRLGRSEVSIGGAFLFPEIGLESTAPGLRGPRTGRTRSDSGAGVASSLGVVYQPDDQRLTLGMGLMTLGGGGVNFPGDTTNPILSGVGPLGNVQGPISSAITLVQMTPTAAYRVTDRLVFGLGPTASIAVTSFDPAFFGQPDDANGDGIGTFPTGSHSRPFWGGGFRAGFVYSVTDRLDVGFGYTSPQWFERWTYHARNELGAPRTLTLNATLPAIYSWGVGYRATERLLFAVDLRYFDYRNTDLFGVPVREGGLGWRAVFAAALGGRYQVTDRIALSAGYVYNENPIPAVGTLFNVQGPAINQNTFAVGFTQDVTDSLSMSLGYAYGFRNTLSGPVREANGLGVKISAETHQLTFAMQIRFGGTGRKRATAEAEYAPVSASADPAQPSATGTGR